MALVLDTGPIYSSIDRSDPDHDAVARVLREAPRPHIVIEPVLMEVDYWLRKYLDVTAFEAFIGDIEAGRYTLASLEAADLTRAAELERLYCDSSLGFVDAAVIAVCERLQVGSVLTFDRRHFGMVRPAHRAYLELLP